MSLPVSTVILVMLENRSFDHMLGHLRRQNLVPTVDGLDQDLSQYTNVYAGGSYDPFPMRPGPVASDLPHEWNEVDAEPELSLVTGEFSMKGFVKAWVEFQQSLGIAAQPTQQADPMGYFEKDSVPITSFLARNFCTCDRWFSPLPTSTQPNRTMAFCGTSQIHDTPLGARLIPTDTIIFDWLESVHVRWRVYHDGLPFYALYRRAWNYIFDGHFRNFEYFFHDMQTEPADSAPQVIIVEPSYSDGPHIGPDHPNDNHPPQDIGWGEEFLRRTYQAATVNQERWSRTVLVYYYDEHGGFFDHVPPPKIPYQTRGRAPFAFKSLGPRIPGIIVSPLVTPASVCHDLLDHTSVLQFLAELFTPGHPYSADVDQRKQAGIKSLSVALGDTLCPDIPGVPADPIQAATALGDGVRLRPSNGMQASFDLAASQLLMARHENVRQKFPELLNWKDATDKLRRDAP